MPRHSAPRALLILLLLRGLRQRRRHLGSDSFTFSTLDSTNTGCRTNGKLSANIDSEVVTRVAQHLRHSRQCVDEYG